MMGVRGHASNRRKVPLAAVFGLIVGLAAVGWLPFAASQGASAANVSLTLYANVLGWSTSPGGESNPGPTLVVNQGDQITLTLTSEDGLEHGFYIDYNGNGSPDGGDYLSPRTSSTITDTFSANLVGQFTYADQVLPLNDGSWVTNSVNHPPTAAISAPTGTSSWTGGAPHDIVFSVSDPDGDALEVVLTYSYNGGAGQGTIQGPFAPGPNPNRVSWIPSDFTAMDTVVHLSVEDARGMSANADSPPFEMDSTAPTIVSSSPGSGASGVDMNAQISVVWSEEMNTATSARPETFGVRAVGGAWLSGSASWSADAMQMTFDPATSMAPATSYEAHVNATAKDDSDPGNALAAPAVWMFSTSSVADDEPPTIQAASADPPQQISNGFVNLTADVQDNSGVWGVSARITGPAFDQNLTMTYASGMRWYLNRSYSAVGHYAVVIWATDAAGNAASQAAGIDIVPGSTVLPAPASVSVSLEDGTVQVAWSPVSVPGLVGYNVYRGNASTGPFSRLTITPLSASAPTVYTDGSAQAGATYFYTVTSVNTTGAESAYARPFSVTIPPFQSPPLLNPLPWAVAGVTLAIILGAIYGLVWRRRTA